MKSSFYKLVTVMALVVSMLALPRVATAQVLEEEPSAVAMVTDLVVVRPIMAGITVLGTAAYIASLPFTLAGGNSEEAAETLVIKPATTTFVRCLGCTQTGRKEKADIEK